jgi:hypothetical protein
MAQEPLGFRCWGFSPQCARTHSGILTSPRSTGRFHAGFTAVGNAPLPTTFPLQRKSWPRFGGPLNPDHSRRIPAGLVSYYALFKGMAASKPTSQLSQQRHLLRYTQRPLRGLSGGSGVFPSRRWTLSLSDCLPGFLHDGIRSLVGVGMAIRHPRPSSRSTPAAYPISLLRGRSSRGSTSIDFGENQLSPGLISLSPLPTSHPSGFQPTPVRASTWCYPSFTLLMGRSPWLRV